MLLDTDYSLSRDIDRYLESRRRLCEECGKEIGNEWYQEHGPICEECEETKQESYQNI